MKYLEETISFGELRFSLGTRLLHTIVSLVDGSQEFVVFAALVRIVELVERLLVCLNVRLDGLILFQQVLNARQVTTQLGALELRLDHAQPELHVLNARVEAFLAQALFDAQRVLGRFLAQLVPFRVNASHSTAHFRLLTRAFLVLEKF